MAWSKRRKVTTIVVLVVAVVAIIVTVGVIARRNSTDWLVDEQADIDEAILQQGTMYTTSVGTVIREYGVDIGIVSAGRLDDRGPGASIGISLSADHSVGVNEWIPLGGSMTLDGAGTLYLTALSTKKDAQIGYVQEVSVLYIPEP